MNRDPRLPDTVERCHVETARRAGRLDWHPLEVAAWLALLENTWEHPEVVVEIVLGGGIVRVGGAYYRLAGSDDAGLLSEALGCHQGQPRSGEVIVCRATLGPTTPLECLADDGRRVVATDIPHVVSDSEGRPVEGACQCRLEPAHLGEGPSP